jgi:hypothetical protein
VTVKKRAEHIATGYVSIINKGGADTLYRGMWDDMERNLGPDLCREVVDLMEEMLVGQAREIGAVWEREPSKKITEGERIRSIAFVLGGACASDRAQEFTRLFAEEYKAMSMEEVHSPQHLARCFAALAGKIEAQKTAAQKAAEARNTFIERQQKLKGLAKKKAPRI